MSESAAPAFSPDAWNDPKRADANSWIPCFQYAFAGSNADGTNRLFNTEPIAWPGDSKMQGNQPPVQTKEQLVAALAVDGISVLPGDQLPPVVEGKYRVGIYMMPGDDWHFMREDRDGGWSQKPGTVADVERYMPPTTDGKLQPLPQAFHALDGDYTLVGYAYAPKEGINLGPENGVAKELAAHPTTTSEAMQQLFAREKPGYIEELRATMQNYYPKDVARFDEERQYSISYRSAAAAQDKSQGK